MKDTLPRFVLDAFALLAFFQGEPGAERVKALLDQARGKEVQLHLCLINYGEVLYLIERRRGIEAAREAINIVDHLPIVIVGADRALTFAAARMKAQYRLSYADAFAVALAQALDAMIITGDPELKSVEGLVRIEWLNQPNAAR